MSAQRKIKNFFGFIAAGIVTIIVGFFMLRGTMNLWNKKDSKNNDSDHESSEKD